MIKVTWLNSRGAFNGSEEFESLADFHETLIDRWKMADDPPVQNEFHTAEDFEKYCGETLDEGVDDGLIPKEFADLLRDGTPVYSTSHGDRDVTDWRVKPKTNLELALEWARDDGAGFRIEVLPS